MQTNDSIEFQSIQTINDCNDRLLRDHVQYCYKHSEFYRRRFRDIELKPEHINAPKDLRLLPLTTKEEVEENGEDLLCVPEREIIDMCQTSGSTGKPVVIPQTRSDLERVGYNEKMSFIAAGITEDDRVMITCALGRCFMAGLAYFEGARQIGATAVRTGSGNLDIIIQSILLYRPAVIVCVPSQALLLSERLLAVGENPAELGVRILMCIGEPVRTADLEFSQLGERLRENWDCEIIGTYACTEMATSFTDCSCGRGGHFHPELIVVEIIDEKGSPVSPGQPGEVIVTPLQVTGMPLLRYCTGDIASYFTEPCQCGRNSYRLGPIVGRKQHKMKISGTTVYPNAIFSVLQGIPEIKNYYLEVQGKYELSETIRVIVGTDNGENLLADFVAEKIRGHIRLKPEVVVDTAKNVAARTTQNGKRKTTVFFDCRNT